MSKLPTTPDQPESEQPILTPLSWEQVKYMDKLQRRMQRKQRQLLENDLSDYRYTELETEVDKIYEDIQSMIAKSVVDIPRSWLVASAPTSLGWSDPASLNYLQGPKMTTLVKLVTGAGADESAKN